MCALLSSSCGSQLNKHSLQCGQGNQFISPNKRLCARSYRSNGHWETRLQLEIPTLGNETETELRWAYPPYLSTLVNAAGPLVNTPFPSLVNIFLYLVFLINQDLIAVPVNRENCSNSTGTSSEEATSVSVLMGVFF
jgi:hypothetical protein